MASHKKHLPMCRKRAQCTCKLKTSTIKDISKKDVDLLNNNGGLIRQKLKIAGIGGLLNVINGADPDKITRRLVLLRKYWLNRETMPEEAERQLIIKLPYIER
jgi:hypothetical protein